MFGEGEREGAQSFLAPAAIHWVRTSMSSGWKTKVELLGMRPEPVLWRSLARSGAEAGAER
jgi:hypothetical protein